MKHPLDNVINNNMKLLGILEMMLTDLEHIREEDIKITEEYMLDWKRKWNKVMVDYKVKIKDDCDKVISAINISENV